jgi:hypothetical protein
MGSVLLSPRAPLGSDGAVVEPSLGAVTGRAVTAAGEKAEDPDDTLIETADGCAANMRSSSSPSLSRFAEGSSGVSSSCGRFTP